MAHERQSRPDLGLGFQEKVLKRKSFFGKSSSSVERKKILKPE